MTKIICIDYDGTITTFPELLLPLIRTAVKRGFRVIVCTMRYPSERTSSLDLLKDKEGVELIFTSRKAKKPYLENMNIRPDLWIDDNPHWILEDSV